MKEARRLVKVNDFGSNRVVDLNRVIMVEFHPAAVYLDGGHMFTFASADPIEGVITTVEQFHLAWVRWINNA